MQSAVPKHVQIRWSARAVAEGGVEEEQLDLDETDNGRNADAEVRRARRCTVVHWSGMVGPT